MKRLFLFLLTTACLLGQNQNVTIQPSPGSGGMNTGTFNTYGINYYLAKPATTWDFTQATVLLPQSISGVLSINAGPGIGVNSNTGQVTVSNLGVITLTAGNGLVGTSTAGNITLNNVGVLGLTAGNGISITGNNSNLTIASTSNATGTVTNVTGNGSVQGITLTGNVTTSGALTLGGSLTPISLTSQVSGILPIANGGTGVSSPSAVAGTGISVTGTFPNQTFTNTGVTNLVAGTGVTLNSASGSITINATGTGGTLTGLSVVTNNGIGSVVTSPNTNPVVTLNLGAITPSSVTTPSLTVGSLTGPVVSIAGTYGVTAQSGTGIPAYNNAPSITNATLLGTTNAVNVTTNGLESVANLRTTGLTGYLYGNSSSNVSASTTIPTSSLSGTISNAQLANSSITIAGTATALGGSISQDTITGLSTTGIVKRTATNTLAIATVNGDYLPATTGNSSQLLASNGSGGMSNVNVGSGLSYSGGTLSSTSAGGSVTNVTVTPNSGVLAGVTTPTTTPSISIGLGNITPLSVTTNAGSFTTLNSSGQTLLATGGSNVGIGNSSPSYPLDVVGNVRIKPASGYNFFFQNSGTTARLNYLNDAFSANISAAFRATDFSWQKGDGSEILKLDSIGNLGLGVTPANWASGRLAIQIGNTTSLENAASGTFLANNVVNSGGTNVYQVSGIGPLLFGLESDSNFHWYTVPSGTAGNPVTFTERMRLDINGNLGLGTSSPSSYTSGGGMVINSTQASTSTSSGALVISPTGSGGLGIGGSAFVGGNINVAGTSAYNYFAGNTGIGDSSPTAKFSVLNASSTTAYGKLIASFRDNSNSTIWTNYQSSTSGYGPVIGVTGDNLLFGLATVSGPTEYMRITSAGNVGIGTTSPASILTLQSAFTSSGIYPTSPLLFTTVGTYVWQVGAILPYTAANNNGPSGYPGGLAFQTKSPDGFAYTSATTKMALDANGLLGIDCFPSGTSTTSTSTTSGALQVAGGVGIQGKLYVGGNIALTNSSNDTVTYYYPASGYNAYNLNMTPGTSFYWGTSRSSAYDTLAMTLSSAGQLTINSYGVSGFTSVQQTSGGYCSNYTAVSNGGNYYYAAFTASGYGLVGQIYSNTSTTTYATTSDKRLKTPLRSWSLGDKFDDIPIGEFNWLKDGSVGHGTLAQDLYKIYPDAVHKGNDKDVSDPYMVDYGKLTVPLIAEVKTLRSRVKTLESRTQELESNQATVLEAINQLKAEFNQYKKDHP